MTEEKETQKKKPVHRKKKESEGVAETAGAPKREKKVKKGLNAGPKYYGTGRRKEAIAKVWLAPGSGQITINNKSMKEYFCGRRQLEYYIEKPFATINCVGKYDVVAQTYGGGVNGQAGAVSLGIARALVVMNPELKKALKHEGLMTRDPRVKERKKYGLKRARKAFQYTKR